MVDHLNLRKPKTTKYQEAAVNSF